MEWLKINKAIYEAGIDLYNSFKEKKDRENFSQIWALYLLLNSVFAHNAGKILDTRLDSSSSPEMVTDLYDACREIHNGYRNEAERGFESLIVKDEYLKNLKKRIISRLFEAFREDKEYITRDEMQTLVQKKNEVAAYYGTRYHGEVVYHADSDRLDSIDDKMILVLFRRLVEVAKGSIPRTQFHVVMGHALSHVMVLDASFDADKKLRLICVESARTIQQWEFLKEITRLFVKAGLPFEVLACQTGVQRGLKCKTFALMLGTKISQFSFAQLKKFAVSSKQCSTTQLFDGPDNPRLLSDLDELPGVQWFPATVLGMAIVKMNQSLTQMRESLKAFTQNEGEVDKIMKDWAKRYEFDTSDPDSKRTYVNYRSRSLLEKLRGTLYSDLSVEKVLAKMEASSVDESLRKLAKKEGPKREMAFLLDCEDSTDFIDKADEISGETALHLAIDHAPKRACLLLSKGARFDIQDKSEPPKTARKRYQESQSEELKNIEFIARQFKLLK
ncbi:MAG: hypothetical protein ACHQJ6_00735 [Candidatus Berkiellales bacterium]